MLKSKNTQSPFPPQSPFLKSSHHAKRKEKYKCEKCFGFKFIQQLMKFKTWIMKYTIIEKKWELSKLSKTKSKMVTASNAFLYKKSLNKKK